MHAALPTLFSALPFLSQFFTVMKKQAEGSGGGPFAALVNRQKNAGPAMKWRADKVGSGVTIDAADVRKVRKEGDGWASVTLGMHAVEQALSFTTHATRTSQARASPREPPRAKPHVPHCGSFSFAQTVTFVTASRKAPTMRRIGSSRSSTRRGRCTWDSRATTSTRPKALNRTNRVALQATPSSSRVPTERSSIRRLIRRRCVRRLGLKAQMQHACCSL